MTNIIKFYKNIFLVLFISLAFIFLNFSFADENNNLSKLSKCVTCHTATGNSTTTIWPKLAEQHAGYMMKQLLEFRKGKDGSRYDPTMLGMLQGVTEEELVELSNYFSKQVLEKSKIKLNENDIATGKILYLYGDKENNITACVGCHGIDGTGNKLANFPSLKMQHKDYLTIQLKKFRSGDRSNDINGIMRDIALNMSDNNILSVASYIATLS